MAFSDTNGRQREQNRWVAYGSLSAEAKCGAITKITSLAGLVIFSLCQPSPYKCTRALTSGSVVFLSMPKKYSVTHVWGENESSKSKRSSMIEIKHSSHGEIMEISLGIHPSSRFQAPSLFWFNQWKLESIKVNRADSVAKFVEQSQPGSERESNEKVERNKTNERHPTPGSTGARCAECRPEVSHAQLFEKSRGIGGRGEESRDLLASVKTTHWSKSALIIASSLTFCFVFSQFIARPIFFY